ARRGIYAEPCRPAVPNSPGEGTMSYYRPYSPPPRPSASVYVLPLLALLAVALILVWRFWPSRESGPDPTAQLRTVAPAGKLADAEEAAIELYKNAAPSVVNITNLTAFTDRFSLNLHHLEPKGIGSGFVWDNQGRIVTNYHVVQGASAVRVTLANHKPYTTEDWVGDPNMDLAVVFIPPSADLKPILLGESSKLKVGQWAFAIGNPFGLDQSLAPGFISALGREIESVGGRPIRGVIQTTAPINPGNSGGPLLDSSGRLIGVNTAILSESGAWAGIGFAIPLDDVTRVVTQLIQHGKVTRPGLGIVPAPDELARQLGVRQGVLIIDVYRGGAAAQAGLRPTYEKEGEVYLGDVILKIN